MNKPRLEEKQTNHEKAIELYLVLFFAAVVGYGLLAGTGVFR